MLFPVLPSFLTCQSIICISINCIHHPFGSYTCLATNPVGSAELNVHLRVVDPPRIAGPPEETSLAELNKAHTIQCQFEGTQPMRVEWLFQDQLVAGTQGEGQPEGKFNPSNCPCQWQ